MSAELIHQMYIAYYQRPADPAGLIYWQDQLNANGVLGLQVQSAALGLL